jgi:hypothetical protein
VGVHGEKFPLPQPKFLKALLRKARRRGRKPRQDQSFFADANEVSTVSTLMPPNALWPMTKHVKLVFGQSSTLAGPNTNVAGGIVYNLNGPFNCNFTTSSGTPFQWAAVAAAYNKYLVVKAKFQVRFYDPDVDGAVVGVQLRGPTVIGATASVLRLRPGNMNQEMANTGEQSLTMRGDVDCARAMGEISSVYRANYGALVTATPGGGSADFSCFLQVFCVSTIGGTATNLKLDVKIEYDIHFKDLVI